MAQYKCRYSAKGCKDCELILQNKLVPCMGLGFDGNSTSDIMFIGEAPGYYEAKDKVPFIGDSGQLLRKYIKKHRLDDVSYITNVVKCRPPANRTPTEYEIKCCAHHLDNEILQFKPKMIVLLGKVARLRFGINDTYKGENVIIKQIGKVFIVCTYHPSYLIRTGDNYIYDEAFKIISVLYNKINPLYIVDF